MYFQNPYDMVGRVVKIDGEPDDKYLGYYGIIDSVGDDGNFVTVRLVDGIRIMRSVGDIKFYS